MSVESWDPGAARPRLDAANLARLVEAAQHLDEPRFGLDQVTAGRLAPLARHAAGADWEAAAHSLEDGDIVALIRLFTLAESALSGWEAGAQSPVVPLAAALKRRGSYPGDLTAWIRAHSDNRFLPYGSLMDRL